MNWILPAMVFLPFAAAIPSYALGRKKSGGSLLLLSASSIAVFALALALLGRTSPNVERANEIARTVERQGSNGNGKT